MAGNQLWMQINQPGRQTPIDVQEHPMAVIEMLNAEQLDLLEVSGGNYDAPAMIGAIGERNPLARKKAERTLRREAYFMEYARRARPLAKMPLMITGGFRTLDAMEGALAENATDVVGLARPFCASTDFPGQLLRGEVSEVPMIEETMLLDREAHIGKLDDLEHARELARREARSALESTD